MKNNRRWISCVSKEKISQAAKKGQSAFEYIILLAGVIVVLIVFLSPTGTFRYTIQNILNQTVNQLENLTNDINFE